MHARTSVARATTGATLENSDLIDWAFTWRIVSMKVRARLSAAGIATSSEEKQGTF
jgi:hypothetical protein